MPPTERLGVLAANICNICGTHVPAEGRDSDICPGCNLRTRHRAVAAFMARHGDPTLTGRTLICHATPNELKHLFPNIANLTNFDIRPMTYLDFTMDIQDMSRIASGSVDSFIALHVLNHVANDVRALEEIARVLRPETGVALLTVPVNRNADTRSARDITQHYGANALRDYGVGTYRNYGLSAFKSLLEPNFLLDIFETKDPIIGETTFVFRNFPHPERLAAG